MSTNQTVSEALAVGKSEAATDHERPATPKAAAETESVAKRAEEHPVGAAIAPPETQPAVEATGGLGEPSGAKPEPQTGEKRDLDSTTTPTAGPVPRTITEDKDKPASEKVDEPDTKKQKTETNPAAQPAQDTIGPAPAVGATAPTSKRPKKDARSKEEKVKEAMKKIPSDGISK